LTWADVLPRDDRVQLSILGKGGKVRQVLLPEIVNRALSLRGGCRQQWRRIPQPEGGGKLTERNVNAIVKRAATKAGINEAVSPHWLRHAHGSHAIDRGASLPEVQTTLGHDNIATTSGYLHARPDTSSGLHLDPGVFLRWGAGLNAVGRSPLMKNVQSRRKGKMPLELALKVGSTATRSEERAGKTR
jgi:integrase/recombinase XerD